MTITGPGALTASYVNEAPAGTFNYGVLVSPTQPNGTYTGTVVATDRAGNATTNTFTLCVNKTQIALTVELEEHIPGEWDMETASMEYEKRDANTVVFRVPLPANGKSELDFRYHRRYVRY